MKSYELTGTERIIAAGYIRYLYDVTVAYTDAIVQSEVDLVVFGASPRDVHYQVAASSVVLFFID